MKNKKPKSNKQSLPGRIGVKEAEELSKCSSFMWDYLEKNTPNHIASNAVLGTLLLTWVDKYVQPSDIEEFLSDWSEHVKWCRKQPSNIYPTKDDTQH